jgi:protein-S-isoprenylcysteine O-methyltransferase Ste14
MGGMELIPALEIGWLNGWILLCLYVLISQILMKTFPKNVRIRLWGHDRFGRSKKERVFNGIGKLLGLVYLILIIFTPLEIRTNIFILGIILYLIGFSGVIIALFNFKNTPPDQAVTSGLYKISRHPQEFMLFILFLGICIAIGSWLALFILIISKLFRHFGILGEEKSCLERYGDSYGEYMKRVPRYFLIKTHMKEEGENVKKD